MITNNLEPSHRVFIATMYISATKDQYPYNTVSLQKYQDTFNIWVQGGLSISAYEFLRKTLFPQLLPLET